jgi:DNA-binding transcriptional LysR family regulator
LFADDLARLAQEHPDLTLETVSSGQLADLQRGDADLALRIGPIQHQDIVARSLGEVGSSMYASPRYLQDHPAPTNLSDLSDTGWWRSAPSCPPCRRPAGCKCMPAKRRSCCARTRW